jgi:hypothetical protein
LSEVDLSRRFPVRGRRRKIPRLFLWCCPWAVGARHPHLIVVPFDIRSSVHSNDEASPDQDAQPE